MIPPSERDEPWGWCALCKPRRKIAATTLIEHLRVVHGYDEPATWPDGEFVVIDSTLEPDDFEEEP